MTALTEASLEQMLKDLTAIHQGGQAITQRQYLRQARERERIREHMKTALSMDVPTSRAFSSEYYLDDPYLDVRLGTLDGWCFGRFIHDPLWNDVETGLPVGDTLILGWTDPTPFLPRRVRCSPALMQALQRVVNEP
ncbi:MAG: hypothetical protein DMG70_04995 [Acidobacteria bacterium]|nr:MAG: hypothetical protein DMG70_04995 [Acidobacteriota bacterium]